MTDEQLREAIKNFHIVKNDTLRPLITIIQQFSPEDIEPVFNFIKALGIVDSTNHVTWLSKHDGSLEPVGSFEEKFVKVCDKEISRHGIASQLGEAFYLVKQHIAAQKRIKEYPERGCDAL